MKTQLAAWILLLCFAALPIAAEPDLKKEDTILGTWHVQVAEEMVFGAEMSMQLDFGEDGLARGTMKMGDEEDEEVWKFVHDKQNAKLTLYDLDDQGNAEDEAEVVLNYSFIDDMLVLRFKDGPGDREATMELTRKPEATERHQAMREEAGDQVGGALRAARETARAMQSSTQMRGLHQGVVMYAQGDQKRYPASVGDLVVGDYCTPEYILSPWSEVEVPKDFGDWQDQKKIEWANKNSSYVYLVANEKMQLDSELIAFFELPTSVDQGQVRLIFDDNHVESKAYDEADKLIKKQTGHTIAQWMKTTSPGTGEMILPKKQDEPGQDQE